MIVISINWYLIKTRRLVCSLVNTDKFNGYIDPFET